MKRTGIIFSFIFLGLFSFCFFLYFTFPYEVLKEAVAMRASEALGLNIQIGELGPSLPLGIKAQRVKVASPGGQAFQLNQAKVNVGILNLLFGKLAVNVELEDERQGSLVCQTKIGLFKLLSGDASLPSSLFLEAKKFLFGKIVDFVLNSQAQNPDVNVMLRPWLESVDIDGRLNALVDLSIDDVDLSRSEGVASFSLDQTVVKSLNANLPIPDQRFSKAMIKASLKNGVLDFDKNSGFVSQDLSVALSGKIMQRPDLTRSLLDLDIGIELGAPLQEQLGIILYAITNRDTQGKLQIKINGSLSPQPNITFL